jgi:hypothetical protein
MGSPGVWWEVGRLTAGVIGTKKTMNNAQRPYASRWKDLEALLWRAHNLSKSVWLGAEDTVES